MKKVTDAYDAFEYSLQLAKSAPLSTDKQTPTNDLKHLKRAYMDDLNDTPINSLSVDSKTADESPIETEEERIQRIKMTLAGKYVYGLKKAYGKGTDGESVLMGPDVLWLVELAERHTETPSTDNTNRIETLRYDLRESERKRKAEAESSDTWRNKYIAADNELKKAEVKHDAEVRNLKYEIDLLNKALEAHTHDEKLLLLTMKKAVSFAERVAGE